MESVSGKKEKVKTMCDLSVKPAFKMFMVYCLNSEKVWISFFRLPLDGVKQENSDNPCGLSVKPRFKMFVIYCLGFVVFNLKP